MIIPDSMSFAKAMTKGSLAKVEHRCTRSNPSSFAEGPCKAQHNFWGHQQGHLVILAVLYQSFTQAETFNPESCTHSPGMPI